MPDDAFGSWQQPGTGGGGESTSTPDPGPTTPAIVDGVPFWDSSTYAYVQVAQPGPWKRCKLGKHQLPGVVTVTGTPAERKIDVKDAPGKGDATITVKGWSPSSFKITMVLWTPDQLREWLKIQDDLLGKDGSSDPLDIINPVTEAAKVRSVILKSPGLIEDGPVRGTKKITLDVVKWVASAKTTGTGTPKGSKSAGANNQDDLFKAYQLYITYAQQQRAWGASTWKTWWEFAAGVLNPVPPPPPGYPQYAPPPKANEWMTPA
jgi:hypothetical protein